MLNLSNLKQLNTKKKKKRLGRGNGSGHGTYSTRGIKGQKSRSGGRRKLKIKGFKQLLSSIPKNRGFKRLQKEVQIVNFLDINNNFKEGETINAESLLNKKLIKSKAKKIKILAKGELKIKGLNVFECELSNKAKEHLESKGGVIK